MKTRKTQEYRLTLEYGLKKLKIEKLWWVKFPVNPTGRSFTSVPYHSAAEITQ